MRQTAFSTKVELPVPLTVTTPYLWMDNGYCDYEESERQARILAKGLPVVLPSPSDQTMSVLTHRSVTKSDVMENIRDSSGWRMPSAYYYQKVNDGVPFYIYAGYNSAPLYGHAERSDECIYGWKYYPGVNLTPRVGLHMEVLPAYHASSVQSRRDDLETACMQQTKAQSLNAALALIESRQSAALLATYIRRIAGVVRSARKRDPRILTQSYNDLRRRKRITKLYRRGKPVTRSTADLWLETYYGLMPLVYDTQGVADVFQRGLRDKEQLLIARSKWSAPPSVIANSTNRAAIDDGGNARAVFDLKTETETLLNEKMSHWFVVEDPSLLIAKELGFTNPASLAWDAIPLWSLLTDWVVPIGSFLELLDYDLGLGYKGGSYTKSLESKTRITDVVMQSGRIVEANTSASSRLFTLNREIYVVPPKPHRPKIRNPFRVERAVSAVALLRQRLR